MDRLHANCPIAECPACELNARVEKVLQAHVDLHEFCRADDMPWPCPTVRLLNGEDV